MLTSNKNKITLNACQTDLHSRFMKTAYYA